MSPLLRMPDDAARARQATLEHLADAVAAARCSAELAGSASEDFVVRELLLTVIAQLDHAIALLRRLG